jgi:hypothetical protein
MSLQTQPDPRGKSCGPRGYVGSTYAHQVLDSLYVIKRSMRHFSFEPRCKRMPAAISLRLMLIMRRRRSGQH